MSFFTKKDFINLFLDRGEGREEERERNVDVIWQRYTDWLPLSHTPNRGLAHNPGMCPDWESNRQPFSLQAVTQSAEPHHPGLLYVFYLHFLICTRKMLVPVPVQG